MALDRYGITVSGIAIALFAVSSTYADSSSLQAQAKAADATRYSFIVGKGAEIKATGDNMAFTLWWQPSTWSHASGVIVALHGHDSYATTEAALWQPYAEKYGFALLTLQWWFGAGETTSDYYRPEQIYLLVSNLLVSKNVKVGSVFFTGFSRGSANSYAVATLDHAAANRNHFALVLSNAGSAASDYPPNQQISAGSFGSQPFAGMKWAMYCGEKDPDPDIGGCPAMLKSSTWVKDLGASMQLFIDDPIGNHGGFMTNPSNVTQVMELYRQVLADVIAATPTTAVVTAKEANCFFDWAEDHYPALLAPARPVSESATPYYYRRYGYTQTALGISALNQHLYFLDADKHLNDIGAGTSWLATSGCR